MKTLFTRIIEGEIPAQKIYEDDTVISILDINPIQKGHALVITKTPYAGMWECDEETLAHAFSVAKKLMIHMKNILNAEFVQVLVEGVEVPHFHIHLIPSMPGAKNVEFEHRSYDEGEMQEYAKKLQLSL